MKFNRISLRAFRYIYLLRFLGIGLTLLLPFTYQAKADSWTWNEYYNSDDDIYYTYFYDEDTTDEYWYYYDPDDDNWYTCEEPEDAGDEIDNGTYAEAFDENDYGDASTINYDDVVTYGQVWGGVGGGPFEIEISVDGSIYSGMWEGDSVWVSVWGDEGEYDQEIIDGDMTFCSNAGMHHFHATANITVYDGDNIEVYTDDDEDGSSVEIAGAGPADASGTCTDCLDSSVDVTIPLGVDTATRRGSSIKLYAQDDQKGPVIYDPDALVISGGPDKAVAYDANGTLRQIITAQSFVDVVNIVPGKGYELDFYHAGQISGPNDKGFYDPPASGPYEKWTFSDRDNSGGTALRVTDDRDGVQTIYDYVWAEEPLPGNRGWALTTSSNGQDLRKETHSYSYAQIAGVKPPMRTAENRVILNPDGTTAEETTSLISYINGYPVVAQEIVGPNSNNPLITRSSYWEDSKNPRTYLRKKMTTDPNGHWVYYNAYTKAGRPLQWTEQYLNNAFSGTWPDPINRNFQTSFDSHNPEQVVRTDTESIGSTVVSRKWQVLGLWGKFNPQDHNNFRKTINVTATKTSAKDWTDVSNLVTTTYLYDETDSAVGKLRNTRFLVVNPDGTGTMYHYYTDSSTGDVTTVTTTGHIAVLPTEENPYRAVIDQGNETTDIRDQYGNAISSQTVNIGNDGERLAIADQVSTAFDDFGRPTTISYFGGLYTDQTTYGCCGPVSETDRNGVTTTTIYDAMKRPISVTRAGVTTQYVYDAVNHTVDTLIGPPGHEISQGQSHFDSNGLLTWSTDATGKQTAYAKTIDDQGYVVVSATNPDGSTRIQKTYPSGLPYQSFGTAQAARVQYDYGVDANGNRYTTQTMLNATGNLISGVLHQSWSDFAGRQWKTVAPSPSGVGLVTSETFYGNSTTGQSSIGHPVKTTRTGQPDTLMAYDALGQVNVQGSGVSLQTAGGTGSVSETSVRYATYIPPGGTPTVVRQETSTSWITETDSQATVTNAAVDGSGTWTIRNGQTTGYTTSFDPAANIVTETTTQPDNSRSVIVMQNGKRVSSAKYSSTGEQLSYVTYAYDEHGWLQSQTDAATGTISRTYDAAGRLQTVTKPDGSTETHTYADSGPYGGWVETISTSGGETHVKEYNLAGQLVLAYGTGEPAAFYTYDEVGRQKTLTTWQHFTGDPSTSTGAEVTTWNYNDAGALLAKIYPDGTGPSYTYYDNGQLKTRTWARGVITTNLYDPATGILNEVDYSDGTPSVVYSNFDRQGRPRQIRDGSGARQLAYAQGMTTYEKYVEGPLAGFALERNYNASNQLSELTLRQDGSRVYDVNYTWAGIGRLGAVTWGNDTATYGYRDNSRLVGNLTFVHDGNPTLTATKTYDNLQRVAEIDNVPSGGDPMNVAYSYDSRNERTQAAREDGSYWAYAYDDQKQVVSGARNLSDGAAIPGFQFAYDYDSIGNRKDATTNGRAATYSANLLNQYTSRDVPRALDVAGTANPNAAVTVNGQPATFTGNHWHVQLDFSGNNAAQWTPVSIQGLLEDAQAVQSGNLFLAAHPEAFAYDADGNLLSDGRWNYAYDGENRLIRVSVGDAAIKAGAPNLKIAYAYDSQGRRVAEQVNAPSHVSRTLYLYDNWNLLAEIDAGSVNSVVTKSYAWGLDLSGTLQGAGGVGGLLMANLNGQAVDYSYDANGNVLGLVDAATGEPVARYDYDPFGNVVAMSGPAARENPFRFSTKYAESDSGLVYYGYRYYSPSLGRFINRDSAQETGGKNLYTAFLNNPVDNYDRLGQAAFVAVFPAWGDVGVVTGTYHYALLIADEGYSGADTYEMAPYYANWMWYGDGSHSEGDIGYYTDADWWGDAFQDLLHTLTFGLYDSGKGYVLGHASHFTYSDVPSTWITSPGNSSVSIPDLINHGPATRMTDAFLVDDDDGDDYSFIAEAVEVGRDYHFGPTNNCANYVQDIVSSAVMGHMSWPSISSTYGNYILQNNLMPDAVPAPKSVCSDPHPGRRVM